MKEISQNQKMVRGILLEFLEIQSEVKPQQRNIFGLKGFLHKTTLMSIGRKFLLPLDKDDCKVRLKALIEKDFFAPDGIRRFEDYRQTLELEKKNGFQNLAILLRELRKKQKELN